MHMRVHARISIPATRGKKTSTPTPLKTGFLEKEKNDEI